MTDERDDERDKARAEERRSPDDEPGQDYDASDELDPEEEDAISDEPG